MFLSKSNIQNYKNCPQISSLGYFWLGC